MYKKILIPLDNSRYDQAILAHLRQLAQLTKSSLILIHVADGFAARNLEQLNLSESDEIRRDREYLETCRRDLANLGFDVSTRLALGEPAAQIVAAAEEEKCDLIAMSTHGHRAFKDLILGSVASAVRHRTRIPVLLVRGDEPN